MNLRIGSPQFMVNKMKFSVLMTTYHKEDPKNLRRSLNSVLFEQTLIPDQMVLVMDGPVSEDILNVANEAKARFSNEMVIIQLPENLGQSGASAVGLKYCTNELLARMDSDDISEPTRFEKELRIFEQDCNVDVVGGWIGEFTEDENIIQQIREVPQDNEAIRKAFRFRNSINNVTVMMKKSTVLAANGYNIKSANEDYSLYIQMLINGAKFYNIQELLVKVRTGNGMSKRRNDMNIFYDWKKDQKKLLIAKETSFRDYIISNVGCLCFVLMPYWLKEVTYKLFLRRKV